MTSPKPVEPLPAWEPTGRPATRFLHILALAVLLACVGARPFLGEMPFRTSLAAGQTHAGANEPPPPSDRLELARVTFALGLLAATAMWLLGGAIGGGLRIRRAGLAGLIVIFAAFVLASALHASDKRAGLEAALEQISLLTAGFLALQLCDTRAKRVLVVMVLAALAGTMATKGLWEYFVEIPDRIRAFEENRNAWLSQLGHTPQSPQALALENRLRDPAPGGFLALANVFASLLIVLALAAAGLAYDLLAGLRARAATAVRKKGDLPLPLVGAAVLALVALAGALALCLTRSRGGIASLAVALLAAVIVLRYRRQLAPHRRKIVLAIGALLLLGGAGVVAYGLKYDRLPTKTMTFRWMYWSASGQIAREHPLLGVGPANFGSAYLQVRESRAEEAVKDPHNVVVHTAVEYGLPAAAAYLAILATFLMGMCRPTESSPTGPTGVSGDKLSPAAVFATFALILIAVLVGRLYFFGAADNPYLLLLEGFVPVALFAAFLAGVYWLARDLVDSPAPLTGMHIALACGGGAFVLSDLVNFALFLPSTAAIFWLAAGVALAMSTGGSYRVLRRFRWPVALAFAGAIVLAAITLFLPVAQRTQASLAMVEAMRRGDWNDAIARAQGAAQADGLDPLAAADAARVLAMAPAVQGSLDNLRRADQWANQAIERDRANSDWQRLAGAIDAQIANRSGNPPALAQQAIAHLQKAAALNPQDLRLHMELADMLMNAGLREQAMRELDAAEAIDRSLLPDSTQQLSVSEHLHIQRLREKLAAASQSAS